MFPQKEGDLSMDQKNWKIHNPSGSKRVVATKELPGTRWLETLVRAGCRVEVCTSTDVLSPPWGLSVMVFSDS